MKTLSELQEEIEKKVDELGSIFTFPPQANNATAHIQGENGLSQAYAGKYDNQAVKDLIREATEMVAREAVKNPDKFLE